MGCAPLALIPVSAMRGLSSLRMPTVRAAASALDDPALPAPEPPPISSLEILRRIRSEGGDSTLAILGPNAANISRLSERFGGVREAPPPAPPSLSLPPSLVPLRSDSLMPLEPLATRSVVEGISGEGNAPAPHCGGLLLLRLAPLRAPNHEANALSAAGVSVLAASGTFAPEPAAGMPPPSAGGRRAGER